MSEEPAAAQASLSRYRTDLKLARRRYAVVVCVVVLALAAFVVVAWSRGESGNTVLHRAANPPRTLAVASPTAQPGQAWRTSDRSAQADPRWSGTIVTYSTHTVGGRDARTGKQTWSYTRSNRTVCTALQSGGLTVAAFRVNGNCDELTALDTDTGERRWTRTLDMDGKPVDGTPQIQALPYTIMVTSPTVVYAIDPGSGFNRWVFSHYGCTIDRAVLGSAGALISQDCTAVHDCAKEKFCGDGPQLLLRDGINSRKDDDKTNPDLIKWNLLGNTDIPVSVDVAVTALNRTTRALDTLDGRNGKSLGAVTLTPAPSDGVPTGRVAIEVAATAEALLVWIGGTVYAVKPDEAKPVWRASTTGPPTVVPTSGEATPTLQAARVTAATSNGLATLAGTTGTVAQAFSVSAPAGSRVYPLGTGFLVAGTAGSVVYR